MQTPNLPPAAELLVRIKLICEGCGISETFCVLEMLQKSGKNLPDAQISCYPGRVHGLGQQS